MKFTLATISAMAFAVTGSLAQSVSFGAPAPGVTLTSGVNFTVTVDFQDTTSSVKQEGLIISIRGCQANPCSDDTNDSSSIVLYNGPYNPQPNSNHIGFSQSFNVTTPDFGTAPGIVFLTHLYGLGAAFTPILETESLNVNINGVF